MKKSIITALALLLTLTAAAQGYGYGRPTGHKPRLGYDFTDMGYVGLRLGLGIGTIKSDDKTLEAPSGRAGIDFGVVLGARLSMSTPIYLEGGLMYTVKGGKAKGYTYENAVTGQRTSGDLTSSLHYLQVPIVVKYRFDLDDEFAVSPLFGGWFAYGVGGKVRDYAQRKTYTSFSQDYYRRWDGGLRLGCAAEFQQLYAELAYDFGLANICHSDFDRAHTGELYINVGVNF